VLVVAVAALTLGGCGASGDEVGDNPESPLAKAADRGAREKTMRVAFDMEAKGKESISMTGVGTSTDDAARGRVKVKFTQDGETVPMEIINDRDVFWIRSSSFDEIMPAGKRWLHSVDKEVAPSTMTYGDFVEMLRATGGRPTTHYKANVTIDDMLDRSPPETRKRMERYRSFDKEIPIEVWIDSDALLRRLRLAIEHRGESAKMDVRVLEYDVEVNADPPPADQVAEESEVLP
jgi:hypothetical protein